LSLAVAISACGSGAGELISDGGVGIPSVSIAGSAGDAADASIPSALGVSAAVSSTAGVVEVAVSALGASGVEDPLGVSDITLPESSAPRGSWRPIGGPHPMARPPLSFFGAVALDS
jgi:hypothetical protein